MKIVRLVLVGIVVSLFNGCASLPENTYTTTEGCGITQWTKAYAERDVASMSWSGPCVNGLADGRGTHIVKEKSGKQMVYIGQMIAGKIWGDGKQTLTNGWTYEGYFSESFLTKGEIRRPDGRLHFKGEMADGLEYGGEKLTPRDQRYLNGELHLDAGLSLVDARFTGGVGTYNSKVNLNYGNGSGIVYGKYLRDGQVFARFVEGVNYDSDGAYEKAKARANEKLRQAKAAADAKKQAEDEAAYKAMVERRAQRNREGLAMLGNAMTAAAGGQNAAERRQLAIQSFSQPLSGTGSAGAGAGTAGDGVRRHFTPDMVQRLEVAGEPSKFDCLKFELIANPAGGTTWSQDGRLHPATRPLAAPKGSTLDSKTVLHRKGLIATNTCNEQIYATIFSSADATMLEAGSDKMGAWAKGDLGDYRFFFVGGYFNKGDWMVLAEEYDQRPENMAYRHYHITPTHVLVGAWGEHSQYVQNSTQHTETKKAIGRKGEALRAEVNRLVREEIIFSSPSQNFNVYSSPYELKQKGFPSSATANFKHAWDNTN